MFLVTLHHRREGHLLTQGQEEILLIGGFGLFWVAALLAWRAVTHRGVDMGLAGAVDSIAAGTQPTVARKLAAAFTPESLRPYPCSSDDIYCVVEEWSYF